jgi:sugar/nucleoside kinase (ribokinase family)
MASKDVLVCGTLNLETTFPIAGFPLNYEAICYRPFEIRSQPSGVGFDIARALSTLGNRVRLVSMVGSDFLGTVLRQSLAKFGVSDEFILPILDQTPQSIVIFDGAGRRMVNTEEYDADFLSAADGVFVSHEKLPVEPKDFVSSIWERSVARIAVVGMGAAGALLGVRGREACQVRAVQVRPVVNTVGAGDALFSCFLHFYLDGDDPILAFRPTT